jgi:hypothetical protein
MSDDQVWNAFISAIPAQDKARHDLENFQARLLKNALQEIEDLKLEIIQHAPRSCSWKKCFKAIRAFCMT